MTILMNKPSFTILICLLPIIYNAILAIVNAHLITIDIKSVIITEIAILATAIRLALKSGPERMDVYAFSLIILASFGLVLSLLQTGSFFVDHIRNTLIIFAGFILGRRINWLTALGLYKVIIILFSIILLIEISYLPLYVELFNPPSYFANTRGFEIVESNDVGVFSNALGFEGRFSLSVFNGPRTSSLMLEQVSLSYLVIVLSLFTMSFWKMIPINWKLCFALFATLVVLSNESRLAIIMIVFFAIGYFIFPRLQRFVSFYIAPVLLIFGSLISIIFNDVSGDNFIGRIVYSFDHLFKLTLADYFGAGSMKVKQLFDSGYTYLLCAGTIFGALALYIFTSISVFTDNSTARRYVFGLNIYLWLALMIAGTSVFSIKTSFLLWLFAGYASNSKNHE